MGLVGMRFEFEGRDERQLSEGELRAVTLRGDA